MGDVIALRQAPGGLQEGLPLHTYRINVTGSDGVNMVDTQSAMSPFSAVMESMRTWSATYSFNNPKQVRDPTAVPRLSITVEKLD